MEEQINFNLLPSLQQRALIKTVIALCNQDHIRCFTAAFDFESMSFKERQREWQAVVENKVIEKVRVLPLPELLKIRLVDFVKPVCTEGQRWWNYHEFYFGKRFIKRSLHKICWTPQGTVDKKKTAKAIIRDENLDIEKRYKIACIYCLENDIFMLWSKIPEDYRKYLYTAEDPAHALEHPLVVFWTYEVKGDKTRMEHFYRVRYSCTPYKYALEQAVLTGNQVATEYFLQKLSSEEREKWLVISARIFCTRTVYFSHFSSNVDVLCFLLLQMKEEQQIQVLKKYPYDVLSCFLYWPWQGLFMKMAKHVWTFLPTDIFYDLLRLIIKKVKCGFKDCEYRLLFKEFWQQSPVAYKELITDICTKMGDFFLLHLLQIKDKENIELVLKDLAPPDREKVIIFTCKRFLLGDNEMELLKYFVQECLTTNDITIKFREELEECMSPKKEKDMCSELFQLLDDLTQNCDNK